jgi:hypothetical protein
MLPPAVFLGMMKDKRYVVELGFIKRDASIDKANIVSLMAALTKCAAEVEPVTQVGIKGMAATVGAKPTKPSGGADRERMPSKKPCFKWRDQSKCDREDCPFTHKDEDKGKGKPAKDVTKDGDPPARRGGGGGGGSGRKCHACKKTTHGLDQCPDFAAFMATQAPAPVKVTALHAQVPPGGPAPDSPVRADVAEVLAAPAYVNDVNMGPFNVDSAFEQVFGNFAGPPEGD